MGLHSDGQSTEVTLVYVLAVQFGSPFQPVSRLQLSEKEVIQYSSIRNVWDLTQPVYRPLFQEGEHGGGACSLKYCAVGDFALPWDTKYAPKAVHMEYIV